MTATAQDGGRPEAPPGRQEGISDVREASGASVSEDEPLFVLAARLQEACLVRGLTVGVAESCTGGLVAHAITQIAGSSRYFRGGLVAYSNEVKHDHLGVPREVLASHGAVSAQTARAMAEGIRTRLGVDVAASITGVAGPGGGSDAKPVGLTYVATADAQGVAVRRHVWGLDRAGNKRSSAASALELLIERVERRDTPART